MKCRTVSGAKTRIHRSRAKAATREHNWKATKLGCWRTGWECGAKRMSTAQAHDLAKAYLSPQDFLAGWNEARDIADVAYEKARQRFMQ